MTDTNPYNPTVLLESFSRDEFTRSYRFEGVNSVVVAYSAEEVLPALAQVEQAVAQGRHAAGFVSYEAASALNPELSVMAPGDLPLIWFGIFDERIAVTTSADDNCTSDGRISTPELDIDCHTYIGKVEKIREAIARGETYQVNFTTRQRFTVSYDPFMLYRRICRNQQASFCAWLDIGTHRILSASPELFFSLKDSLLTMKPMKGTAQRRPRVDDDQRQREQLAASQKERAENLMIVDLVRNDLAVIAETGSVKVTNLFKVETLPTVHQMTSTVTARIRPEAGLAEIFRALFPCGSVTGAPKRRTMEIIKTLEAAPRGLYCGAIGYVSPGREAVFSVAIRTAIVETASGKGKLGIGSGITWDSDPACELQECLTKGAFLTRDCGDFSLIEGLRLDGQEYLLLERHLQRLAASAAYFGFQCDMDEVADRLRKHAAGKSGIHKVRLLLNFSGRIEITSETIAAPDRQATPPFVAISRRPVAAADPFRYHKTTNRALYDQERRNFPHCYDVVFLNERGEVTEGSFNTLVVSLRGELLTPAIDCGLLPGVLREELLEVGALREALLTVDDLRAADRIWLVNSVRGWRECCLAPSAT